MSNPVEEAMTRATVELKEKLAGYHEKQAAYQSHLEDHPDEKMASDILSEEMDRITSSIRTANDERDGIEPTPSYEVNEEGSTSEEGFKGAEDESDDEESKEAEEKEVKMKDKGNGSQKGDKHDGDSESPNALDYNDKSKPDSDDKKTDEKPEMKAAHIMDLLQSDPDVQRGFRDGLKERAPQILKAAAVLLSR